MLLSLLCAYSTFCPLFTECNAEGDSPIDLSAALVLSDALRLLRISALDVSECSVAGDWILYSTEWFSVLSTSKKNRTAILFLTTVLYVVLWCRIFLYHNTLPFCTNYFAEIFFCMTAMCAEIYIC